MSATERLKQLRQEVEALKKQLKEKREAKANYDWDAWGRPSSVAFSFAVQRRLRGHFGKVYSMHWASDAVRLVSGSQDGKLIVWNAMTENKLHAITLKNAWVMTCAIEQTTTRFVASGGLDNTCSIFDITVPSASISRPVTELTGHDGYLSCCRFLSERDILTSSGDSSCVLWDIERNSKKAEFRDHAGDVMSVSLHPNNPNVFASGSVDSFAKVWDIRSGKCTHTFLGHTSDINSIDFLSNGNCIATGSDDSTCRIFDLRSLGEIAIFEGDDAGKDKGSGKKGDGVSGGITSVAFSQTGRLLFAGYEEHYAVAWETISSDGTFHKLEHNESQDNNRISCVGVNKHGNALCTGSWDTMLAIWA